MQKRVLIYDYSLAEMVLIEFARAEISLPEAFFLEPENFLAEAKAWNLQSTNWRVNF